jgi:hypothetical protein
MNRCRGSLLATLALTLTACGHPAGAGSIDGQPLPAKTFEFNRHASVARFVRVNHRLPEAAEEPRIQADWQRQVCSNLLVAIGGAAYGAELRQLSITVSQSEVDYADADVCL